MILLLGCGTSSQVPVVIHSVDTLFHRSIDTVVVERVVHTTDSVIVKDSTILIIDKQSGQIVSKEKYVDSEKFHDTERALRELQRSVDSLHRVTKSEKPVVVEKVKESYAKQFLRILLAGVALGLIAFFVVWILLRRK